MRRVILVFGPPGAGKTTLARQLAARDGLDVYDRDDPEWHGSEKLFRAALARVRTSRDAHAVIIRAGATSTARAAAARAVGATEGLLLMPAEAECIRRVRTRHRHDIGNRAFASVHRWYQTHDTDDGITPGTTWHPPRTTRVRRATGWRASYGAAHQTARRTWQTRLDAGETPPCPICKKPVIAGQRWDLDHLPGTDQYRGPAHYSCNRRDGAIRGNKARARTHVTGPKADRLAL